MTRNEARAKCIAAMASAMFDCYRGYNDETQKMMWIMAKSDLENKAKRAFDSLNGIARVNPIDATEEMMNSYTGAVPTVRRECWRAMSAVGDLTNPPEKKP